MFRIIAIAYAIFAVTYAYEDDHDDHWDDYDDHWDYHDDYWDEDHEEDIDILGMLFEHEEVCCSFYSYINTYINS